jgi:hypothetical protein
MVIVARLVVVAVIVNPHYSYLSHNYALCKIHTFRQKRERRLIIEFPSFPSSLFLVYLQQVPHFALPVANAIWFCRLDRLQKWLLRMGASQEKRQGFAISNNSASYQNKKSVEIALI